MKAALVQQAIPAAAGVQNWTNSIFTNDALALVLFGGRAATNDVDAAHGTLAMGATDKTRMMSLSFMNQDGVADSVSDSVAMSWALYNIYGLGTLTSETEATLTGVSHPASGIQINWEDPINGAYLVNGLLLGGDDIEVTVVHAQFSGGGAGQSIAVSHQLSGTPDIIIAFGNGSQFQPSGDGLRPNGGYFEIGFYDVQNDSYASIASHIADSQAAATDSNHISSTFILAQNNAGTLAYQVTIESVGASTFNMVTSANTSDGIAFICLRGKRHRMSTKVGIADTPTATGAWNAITGMRSTPQVVLWVPTRMTIVGTSRINDEAGHIGFAASVNHISGTAQAAASSSDDDGAATIDAHNRISNTKSIYVIGVTAAPDIEATLQSWNPDGVTLNVTNAGAVATKLLYCAFGMPAPVPLIDNRPNTLLRM